MKLLQHKKCVFAIIVLLTIIILISCSCYQSRYSLICTSYDIHTDKIKEPVRVLQITDLHNSIFGENNQKLVNLSVEQSPDLILITGDLLNSSESRTDIATNLITDLSSVVPVYISLGNHEVEYQENFGTDIVTLYETAGAVVLERGYKDISVNDQKIRLGGIYGYCLPEKYLKTGEARVKECAFLSEFQNTDLYTLLMCHMPVCWMINDGLDEWDVDCVIAGHVHGGQIRFPLLGGLYGPDLGWFPGKLAGIYSSEDGTKHMVLSRGLGNTEDIPRINNIPEIVVVDLLPDKE